MMRHITKAFKAMMKLTSTDFNLIRRLLAQEPNNVLKLRRNPAAAQRITLHLEVLCRALHSSFDIFVLHMIQCRNKQRQQLMELSDKAQAALAT